MDGDCGDCFASHIRCVLLLGKEARAVGAWRDEALVHAGCATGTGGDFFVKEKTVFIQI